MHVGHVAEGGQVSQVLDQVFQRSAVVSHEERENCQVPHRAHGYVSPEGCSLQPEV